MERRHFLRWSGASIVGLSAGGWLAGCSGEESATSVEDPDHPDRPPEETFTALLERARSLGKPVLVFVAPSPEGSDVERRRTLFSDFVWLTDQGLWSDLALCELACASLEEIQASVSNLDLRGQPCFVLIEDGKAGLRARSLDIVEPEGFPETFSDEDRDELPASYALKYAAWVSGLHAAIAPDRAALAHRAEQARAALDKKFMAWAEECLSTGEAAQPQLLSDAAALFRLAAADHPDKCGRFEERLAVTTRKRVIRIGICGAGWAVDSGWGCGAQIQPERHTRAAPDPRLLSVLCGMGSIDETSKRFLWFYTDADR
ncbi:MAG TPA: hypothetical protein VK843_19640 [Planctomycetota bacterium]|nr:hypothetical protein [Planctomycetota bacterium]